VAGGSTYMISSAVN